MVDLIPRFPGHLIVTWYQQLRRAVTTEFPLSQPYRRRSRMCTQIRDRGGAGYIARTKAKASIIPSSQVGESTGLDRGYWTADCRSNQTVDGSSGVSFSPLSFED